MGYIKVRKANCKNCYKCLKNCISKAIMYKNEKVEIIEEVEPVKEIDIAKEFIETMLHNAMFL